MDCKRKKQLRKDKHVKSKLVRARKVIQNKFRKAYKNRIHTERKLNEKYRPITLALEKLQPNTQPTERESEINFKPLNFQTHAEEPREYNRFPFTPRPKRPIEADNESIVPETEFDSSSDMDVETISDGSQDGFVLPPYNMLFGALDDYDDAGGAGASNASIDKTDDGWGSDSVNLSESSAEKKRSRHGHKARHLSLDGESEALTENLAKGKKIRFDTSEMDTRTQARRRAELRRRDINKTRDILDEQWALLRERADERPLQDIESGENTDELTDNDLFATSPPRESKSVKHKASNDKSSTKFVRVQDKSIDQKIRSKYGLSTKLTPTMV